MKRTKCVRNRWFLSPKEMFYLKARLYQDNYNWINFRGWYL
jgi:hypothetical protein